MPLAYRRGVPRLTDRWPTPDRNRLLADLVPPRRFASASFDTYVPDPAESSQARARAALSALTWPKPRSGLLGRWGAQAGRRDTARGIYLDGGFGVGKTHLLAATWWAAPVTKVYGTFVEYTHLVGALGFAPTVAALSTRRLVCIDEFELDDPGDTVMMARLLRELSDAGVTVVATSNTVPGSLGEGRFAADDFLREIQAVAAMFDILRIDGPDYRHRGGVSGAVLADRTRFAAVERLPGATTDDFRTLCDHLAEIHPSRYGALLDGVGGVCLRSVATVGDQNVALRLVVLADRLYDRQLPVAADGVALDHVFDADMVAGGYRKKYLRAISRLAALTRES